MHIGLVLALLAVAPARADVVLPKAIAASPALKSLRKSMLAGRSMTDVQLQRLADAGEGLAAARYGKRLEERNDPAFLDDAAHYYSIAVYMGREFAVPRLIALLDRPEAEFSEARLANIRLVLDRAVRKGDLRATAGLAKLLMQDRPFGKDIPRSRELRLVAAEAGDAQAALRLALDLIQGADCLPPDPEAARPVLEIAMTSPDPGVKAMVLTLQRQLEGATAATTAPLPASEPEPMSEPEAVSEPEPVAATEPEPPTDVAVPLDASVELMGGPPSGVFPPRPRSRPETLEGPAP